MQFPEQWLRELCNPALDSEALCHLLTMAGLEVEEVEAVAPAFSGVVVAQILAFEKHPNADKLKVCSVDIGRGEPVQIVCGAPNVVVGMKAPCATVGAKLPSFEIKAAKLRGVESFGMMCSADELGLTQAHDGLWVLAENAPVGADLRDHLKLDDKKITIKLTPNRADCLSLRGVARELAALTDAPLQTLEFTPVAPSIADTREVLVSAQVQCPRYLGRVIRGVNAAAATPEWMRQRLERCGVRSISVVVDVTNYVMLALGQPMHAFNNDCLDGAVRVRMASEGDSLALLNGQVCRPSADMLLICDDAKPLALAGVMGGEASGVTTTTQNVFLESAFFDPDAIVGRARALGFSSDASHRFERGVDFELPRQAMEYATALLVEICGGQVGPIVEALHAAALPQRTAVSARLARIESILGLPLNVPQIQDGLQKLGMQVTAQEGGFLVQPPSWRFDMAIEEDVAEEVARIIGYDNIPPLPPKADLKILPLTESQRSPHRVRRLLAGRDFQEVVTYAFVEEAWEQDFAGNHAAIQLANPIASQLAVMRSSLLGGLVETLRNNLRRRADRVRLFELGRCFEKDPQGAPVAGYAQPVRLAALAWGPVLPEQWGQATRTVDFYDLKADVEALLPAATYRPANHPALHPGRSAEVVVDGVLVGVVGELHPAWVQKYDLQRAPIVFELLLSSVLNATLPQYQEISRHPSVARDIALVLPQEIAAGRLLEVLDAARTGIVQSIKVFDVYAGKGLEPGSRSLALRVVLEQAGRTLADEEVDAAMAALIAAAQSGLGAQLRA